jgi:hypothetical protein
MSSLISLIRSLTVSFDRGTNLSSSAYFFLCNISVIFIATGLIRNSPIVCGFLALAIKNDASYDECSQYLFWYCCVLFYQLSTGRGFSISSQKKKNSIGLFLNSVCFVAISLFSFIGFMPIMKLVREAKARSRAMLYMSCYHVPIFRSKSNIVAAARRR